MQSRKVAILLRSYNRTSGVGADVYGMKQALTASGLDVQIFASKHAPGEAQPANHYSAFAKRHEPLTIYHHAIAWPQGVREFIRAPGPRVLRYHNVTPHYFFWRYSFQFVVGAWWGRREAKKLATTPNLDLFLSASEYSSLELAGMGATPSKCSVLPPFDPPAKTTKPDKKTLEQLDDGHINLLFVGKLLPHKGQHHLIRAIAAWKEQFREPVRLCLVGGEDPRLKKYTKYLHSLVDNLGVQDMVNFVGEVSTEVLEAYYAKATVFVVASEHEGFCIPVLEAMRREIPVVAVPRAAVGETTGAAAALVPTFDPEAIAQTARKIALSPDSRTHLKKMGQARARDDFDSQNSSKRLIDLLNPLLKGP